MHTHTHTRTHAVCHFWFLWETVSLHSLRSETLQELNGVRRKIWLFSFPRCVILLDWSWVISNESNCTPFICGAVINGKMQAVKKCKWFCTKASHKLASPFLKWYHYYILKMLICWADFPGEWSKLVLFPNCLAAMARERQAPLICWLQLDSPVWAPSSIDNFRHIKHVLAKVISQF